MIANWYPDQNRFNLAAPSPWWLQLLRDYDAQLVVLPSRVEALYRLTRRVRAEARLGLKAMIVHEHPDTVMMIQYGVVPVASLTHWAIQSDKIIRDLMARDTWRVLGKPIVDAHDAARAAELVTQRMDARESQVTVTEQKDADTLLDDVSSDAFKSLQQRKGERIVLSDHNRGYGAVNATKPGYKTVAKVTNNSVISLSTSSRPDAPRTAGHIVLTDR